MNDAERAAYDFMMPKLKNMGFGSFVARGECASTWEQWRDNVQSLKTVTARTS